MVIIVPDNILEKSLCSRCWKYLSVAPVKIYRNGEKKCGRCCELNEGGATSIYQTVLRDCLYPCINKFEGCNELLHSTKMHDHEVTCTYFTGPYNCPICGLKVLSNYYLYRHIQLQHKYAILSKPEMNLDFAEAEFDLFKTFIYVEENVVFVLMVKFAVEVREIKLTLTAVRRSVNINFKYVVYDLVNSFVRSGLSSVQTYSETDVTHESIVSVPLNVDEVEIKFQIEDIPKNVLEIFKTEIIYDKIPSPLGVFEVSEAIESTAVANNLTGVNGIMFSYAIKNIQSILKVPKTILKSPIYLIGDIPVMLYIQIQPPGSIRAYFFIDPEESLEKPWYCYANVKYELLPAESRARVKNNIFESNHMYHFGFRDSPCLTGHAPSKFRMLTDILKPKNGFVKNNMFTIGVEAKLGQSYFPNLKK